MYLFLFIYFFLFIFRKNLQNFNRKFPLHEATLAQGEFSLTFQGRTCRTASPLVDGIKSPGTFKFVLTYKNCCNYVIFKYFLMKQKLYNFVLVIVIDILKKVYLKLIITYVITLGIQIL